MQVVLVFIRVKPEAVEAFREITLDNARHSLKEPGFLRFDIIQAEDDPTRFVLYEAYRDREVPLRHKETDHYNRWREAVAGMMAEKRYSLKYRNVFPESY